MKRRKSVQATHLGVAAIEDGVITLSSGGCRAALEASSIDFDLQSDTDQEAIVAGYKAFLNSLPFPVQIVVRVVPVDLDHYVREVEANVRHNLDGDLAALAQEYLLYLRLLATHRTLLDRRFYVVVAADAASERSGPWFWRRASHGPDLDAQRKQLTFRCETVDRELSRCGLSVRRLADLELGQLYYSFWCPELSRLQQLRRSLTEMTTPVVRAGAREAA